MVETAVTKRRELVGATQIRGCEVKLDQVSKQYTQGKETVAALDKVSLELKAGELLAVMGTSVTAGENAALPLLMAGQPHSVWRPQVSDWLKRVGLENRRKHYPAELSGGKMLFILKDGRILDSAAR